MPSLFKRLNKFDRKGALALVPLLFLFGCKKKDRLSSPTFDFHITPPASTVLKTETLTLVANGNSSQGPVAVNPTWEVSPTTLGTLNTSAGSRVIFTPTGLGDVTVTATSDGVTATSRLAIVTYRPSSSSNIFSVYSDNGLPSGSDVASDIFFECHNSLSITELSTGYTPEGIKYLRASNATTNDFWGITLDKSTVSGLPCGVAGPTNGLKKDLSSFNTATLKFNLRLLRAVDVTEEIHVELTDATQPAISFTLVDGANGYDRLSTDWQEISIPLSSGFPGLNFSQIKVPFAIVTKILSTPLTFDIDAVRWEK